MSETRKFNVVCVTKLEASDFYSSQFHLPITGPMEVVIVSNEKFGVTTSKTVIRFQEKEYDLLWVDEGLDGTAISFGINSKDEKNRTWKLYTDTPTSTKYTTEEIREMARESIKKEGKLL